jgi:hypothetical protein
MRLLLLIAFQFILLTGSFSQNYYSVKFPDDLTIHGCGAKADTIWPTVTNYGNCNFNVGISIKDQVFYLNATHTCLKILRTWTLLYWCDYNPNWPAPYPIANPMNSDIGPTVIGNSQNHGYLQYTQIIKVIDNVAPVFLKCPADGVVFCDLTGNDPAQYHNGPVDLCEGPVDLHVSVTDACSKSDMVLTYRLYLDLDGNGSMETLISSSDANAWPITTTTDHDTLTGKINFPAGFGLPYGTHKVEWIASDNCGNETVCKYSFIVKDCKAPTVVCINGLSINIMQTGMITLWDTDFLQYTYDNCTPTNQIKIGIRKAGTGSGFPTDSHSVTFNCTEIGTQYVELWAIDGYGNADYCKTYVNIQDHLGSCPSFKSLKGALLTDQGKPVPGVSLKMHQINTPDLPVVWKTKSDATGLFSFESDYNPGTYQLVPYLDSFPKAGVNTLDLLLTAAHLSNIQPLSSPYKIIAADVNHDGLLNDDDVASMIQVITGQAAKFGGNTSWRFVPTAYAFPNPQAPLATAFPELIVFPGLGDITGQDFVAVKTGDVNGSALQGQFGDQALDRKPQSQVRFLAHDVPFEAGDLVQFDLLTPNMSVMAGFQFTLTYDKTALQPAGIQPGIIPMSDMGLMFDQGNVSAVWYSPEVLAGASWGDQRLLAFSLVFKALKSGTLHQVISMNSSVTATEAYNAQMETLGAALDFDNLQPIIPHKLNVLQVQPNPAHDRLTVGYTLPEAGAVSIRLLDGEGRMLLQTAADGVKGSNQTTIDLGSLNQGGLMFLHLDSPYGTGVERVIVER